MTTTDELRVLLGLRLLGFADTGRVAERSGLPVERVADVLDRALEQGWVQRRSGATPGWTLSASGRRRGEWLLGEEHRSVGVTALLVAHYEDFLPLNGRLHAVCTRWQVRPTGPDGEPLPNTHDDPDYDAGVVGELVALHTDAGPLVTALAVALERFATYGERLDRAVERVRAGDVDWFTRPLIDSYHSVWFELHEDLLATLGRDRGAESAPPARP